MTTTHNMFGGIFTIELLDDVIHIGATCGQHNYIGDVKFDDKQFGEHVPDITKLYINICNAFSSTNGTSISIRYDIDFINIEVRDVSMDMQILLKIVNNN